MPRQQQFESIQLETPQYEDLARLQDMRPQLDPYAQKLTLPPKNRAEPVPSNVQFEQEDPVLNSLKGFAQGAGESAFESLVPQDEVDLGLEAIPGGVAAKGISSAIGLVPPHLVKKMVNRLKERSLTRPNLDPKLSNYFNKQIDDNPNVAANLDDVFNLNNVKKFFLGVDPQTSGVYQPINVRPENRARMKASDMHEAYLERLIDNPEKEYKMGGRIGIDPTIAQTTSEMESTGRHEFTHLAQDMAGKEREVGRLFGRPQTYGAYRAVPMEIGARVGGRKADFLKRQGAGQVPKTAKFDYLTNLVDEFNQTQRDGASMQEAINSASYMNMVLKDRKLGYQFAFDTQMGEFVLKDAAGNRRISRHNRNAGPVGPDVLDVPPTR